MGGAQNHPPPPPPRPGRGVGAPDIGAPAAVPQQGLPKGPTRQLSARDAVDAHHYMLGRVASALLGKQIEYQVNPKTGQTEAIAGTQKPGELIRHILN